MPSQQTASAPSLLSDPFREREPSSVAAFELLGGRFEFETESPELRRVVEWAYSRLPRHRPGPRAPAFRVRLRLNEEEPQRSDSEMPAVQMLCGGRLLAAAAPQSTFVVMAPDARSAIVNVAPQLLRFPYHVRYELLELAVFTLATRGLGLVPLHAACVGSGNRGLLLIGESGAGKSTLTLQCSLAGLDFLSEDSVLVAPRTLLATAVSNFAHLCHDGLDFLPAGVARMLARFPTIRRRSGTAKIEIDVRETVFRLAEPPLRLVGTVFLSAASARTGPMLRTLSGRDVAVRLRATQPYAAGLRGWGVFSRLLSRRPGFELRRGKHPADAAEVVTRLLSARKLQPQAVRAM